MPTKKNQPPIPNNGHPAKTINAGCDFLTIQIMLKKIAGSPPNLARLACVLCVQSPISCVCGYHVKWSALFGLSKNSDYSKVRSSMSGPVMKVCSRRAINLNSNSPARSLRSCCVGQQPFRELGGPPPGCNADLPLTGAT